jgi:CRISPR-associated protein Csd1
MMLGALYQLAQRRGLVDDPDFEKKRVDFLLRIDQDGRFLALVPTHGEKERALEIDVPRFPKRAGIGTTPGFLFDNAKYVLGLGGEGADGARNERCVEAFRKLVVDLAEATRDAGAIAVARFFERRAEQLPAITAEHPDKAWTGSEWIAFVLDGDDERLVHNRPAVRAYWAAQRSAEGGAEVGPPVRCLVTGEVALPARMHGSIKRVPQAQSSGATLVTFNAESFASHGLKQGDNAPVSRAAAEGYVTALNWLLEGTPKRPFRQGVRIGDDAVLVFWTREENAIVEDFPALFDPSPDEEQLRAHAESPWKGLERSPLDETAFYAVTLSGNAARVVVRDWLETTVAEVKRNIADYFDALRISPEDGAPLPLRRLLKAVESPGGRGLSPELGSRLYRVALRGDPFPWELLGAALRRLRLPPDKLDERRLLRARCALIKAVLLRPSPSLGARMEVPVSLDESNTQVPYLLGRLFAAIERLQGEAQGDINATIRDRYFGAASATPALIFPRLLRLSVHHAAKLDTPRGDHWLERLKARIVDALPPGAAFPETLPLAAQGLFAIGYYQQRQRFFEKRKDAEDKSETEDNESAA